MNETVVQKARRYLAEGLVTDSPEESDAVA